MLISTSLAHGMGIGGITSQEAAQMMRTAGFDGIDLSMDYNYESGIRPSDEKWTADIIAQAEAAKAAGLQICQSHMPSYPGHIDSPGNGDFCEFEALLLPDYERAIEANAKVGCKIAVMHPFFTLDSTKGSINGNITILTKLLPLMEKYGVAVALENVFARRYSLHVDCAAQHAEVIAEIIERMNTPLVGACIDTGHANIFKYDVCQMARLYGKKLLALHVNANAGLDEHILPYTYSQWCVGIDFHKFSATLKEIGFTGAYNLEVASGKLPPQAALPFYQYAAAIARGLADEAE